MCKCPQNRNDEWTQGECTGGRKDGVERKSETKSKRWTETKADETNLEELAGKMAFLGPTISPSPRAKQK